MSGVNGQLLPQDRQTGAVYLQIDIGTGHLQRKLRTIARHLSALADELEAIEAETERGDKEAPER